MIERLTHYVTVSKKWKSLFLIIILNNKKCGCLIERNLRYEFLSENVFLHCGLYNYDLALKDRFQGSSGDTCYIILFLIYQEKETD